MAQWLSTGYDNCKFMFIYYVVLFHMVNHWYLQEAVKDWPRVWANLFRSFTLWHEKLAVPGFAFLSGFLGGKKFAIMDDSDRWKRSISMLFFGALNAQLVEVILSLVLQRWLGNSSNGNQDAVIPNTINFWDHLETWYLFALLFWRILTPLLELFERPLVLSLMLAMFHAHVSWGEGQSELRMRIFRFFPYYVLGLVTDRGAFGRISRPTLVGSFGVASTLTFSWAIDDKMRWLGLCYTDIPWTLVDHLVLLFQYAFSTVTALSVILLVRQVTFPLLPFSHSNSSLSIYVWHWQILMPLLWGKWPFGGDIVCCNGWPLMDFLRSHGQLHPLAAIAGLHFISYCICVLLGSRGFWGLVRGLSNPNLSCIFRKIEEPSKLSEVKRTGEQAQSACEGHLDKVV